VREKGNTNELNNAKIIDPTIGLKLTATTSQHWYFLHFLAF
jgi:hypothetical protein